MNHTQAQVQSAAIVRMFKTELAETKALVATLGSLLAMQGQYAEDAESRNLQAIRELKAAIEKYNDATSPSPEGEEPPTDWDDQP